MPDQPQMLSQPWIMSYPNGVRWDAPIETGPVQSILEQAALAWPQQTALDFMGREITYAELDRLSERMAAALQRAGVRPGVHVGIYLPNTPHYFISFFGILKAGGTVVNYSPLDAEAVLEHKMEDSETTLLITLDVRALFPQMQRLLGHTGLKTLIVGTRGRFRGPAAGW